jgi:hypothetical protein
MLEHLKSRHLDYNLHTVWLSEQELIATFPLWNLSGQMVGYQQYRPDKDKRPNNNPKHGRYFTKLKDGKVGLWGMESWNLSNTLFLTEGVFDAARLTEYKVSALAVLSSDVSESTKRWLWCVRQTRKVVCVCDNDSAGYKLQKLGHTFVIAEGKDIAESSDTFVQAILHKYL